MTDSEIVSFLNEYKRGVDNKILDFNNEYDFSDEALFNIIVAVEYLVESAQNPNADALFSEIFKKAEIELKNRLGILPEVD